MMRTLYCSPLVDQYYSVLEYELDKRRIPYTYTPYGIRFSTGLDSWIVDADRISRDRVIPTLYHKSLYNCGRSRIPDFHVQFKKAIHAPNLVQYTVNHASKYGVRTRTAYAAG